MSDGDEPRIKRFKYKSYRQSLKDVHLPTAFAQAKAEQEQNYSDKESHFYQALEHWKQLNLSHTFLNFARKAGPISASTPLLLHHWQEVVDIWVLNLEEADEEGLRPLLDLVQKLAHDLRATLSPAYTRILTALLKLLPRPIPMDTLTILLATFTSIFKLLVVPSSDVLILTDTWTAIRQVLPKCLSEVQRAVAEVWAAVIRRLKVVVRDRVVHFLAETIEGAEDATAWVVVYACKSVSQTLHTSTVQIFDSLLAHYLSCPEPAPIYTLLRRTITALIHHVKTAEQFSSLGDVVVTRFSSFDFSALSTGDEHDSNLESLRRIIHLVSVPCAVRRGSRVTASQMSLLCTTWAKLAETSIFVSDNAIRPGLLTLSAALLTVSEANVALWVGCSKVLERTWSILSTEGVEDDDAWAFSLRLNGTLAELGWGGWKMVGLPMLLKATSKASSYLQTSDGMNDEQKCGRIRLFFSFLATLRRHKKINAGEVDMVWRNRLEALAVSRLRSLLVLPEQLDEESAAEVNDILELTNLLSATFMKFVLELTEQLVSGAPDSVSDVFVSTNHTWVIGALFRTLSNNEIQRVDLELASVNRWISNAVDRWGGWSPDVLDGLVLFLRSKTRQKSGSDPRILALNGLTLPAFSELYISLKDAILSHHRLLRLNALRLLVQCTTNSSHAAILGVLKRCLKGEEAELEIQGVRERILEIGKLSGSVPDGEEVAADVAIRWLAAQLKVNLRPVWLPAIAALGSLGQRFGDLLWGRLFVDLKAFNEFDNPEGHVEGGQWINPADERGPEWEDERTWKDPPAYKLRSTVAIWLRSDLGHSKAELTKFRSKERLDTENYHYQILSVFSECSSLAEKHNRDLVPHFLSLMGAGGEVSKLSKQRLAAWMGVFGKFSNPKALHSSQTLHDLYISLLSHPERNLQNLAISCLLTYKSPVLTKREDTLRGLLDQTRWRDNLTDLDFTTAQPDERAELISAIIRVLYGLMLEKRGRANRGADRRAAVLSVLAGCEDDEIGILIDLMLKPLKFGNSLIRTDTGPFTVVSIAPSVTDKQKVGFLVLLGDVVKNIGSRLEKHWPVLLGAVICLTADAQKCISATSDIATAENGEEEEEDGVEGDGDGEDEDDQDVSGAGTLQKKIMRQIRQLGLKRLVDLFETPVAFDYSPYMRSAYPAFISPRLALLDKENTQSPSALLDLFHVWTAQIDYVHLLVDYDDAVLPKIYDCLIATNVKPAVISKIFDIVEALLLFGQGTTSISDSVVKPHVTRLLSNLATLVARTNGMTTAATPLGQRQISILSEIAHYSTDASQASMLLDLLAPLLRKPSRVVSEKVKADLLKIFANLMALVPDLRDTGSTFYQRMYELLSSLFQTTRFRSARLNLVATFHKLAEINPSLAGLALILESLNAYSSTRLDEPDFDRRLTTFVELNENGYKTFSVSDWIPLLYNMLNFIHDPVELAIRNNASLTMRRFADVVAAGASPEATAIFLRILFPRLKKGLKSKFELVRSEILGTLAYYVAHCTNIGTLQEMQALLGAGDEEVNFFNNILHVQIHRRSRALRRLAEHCDQGQLRSSILSDIFIPVVGHFIAPSVDHHLVTDAIQATGRMARGLAWGAYYALIQKYLRAAKSKDQSERICIRTLVALLDNFHFPMDEMTAEENQEKIEEDEEDEEGTVPIPSTAAKTSAKIADLVHIQLLPNLLNHLESHDADTDDTNRIPIAIGIVKVALHLPAITRELQIKRLLTILSQILRSKSQETRDLVRDALNRIAVALGPPWLPTILCELRSALTRGPQLHVLAHVVHSLLVHLTASENLTTFSNFDSGVNDIAHVSAEVIFGEPGKDVESEGFKTKMKEVRGSSSRGMDSFALVAKYITPAKISSLLVPLRAIMHETESAKAMGLVEEVLKRIAGGLNSNTFLQPADFVVLCHTLISQNSQFLKQMPMKGQKKAQSDAIVQLKRQAVDFSDHFANNSYRFIAFGLDLLNVALRRNRFDFHDADAMSRLDGMVLVVGNTLYSANASVLSLGMRCATGLAKCPLKSVQKAIPVYVKQFLEVVRQIGNTESEIAQIALKSIATVLRDGPAAQVKEKDLVYLLELLSPDVEDPSRQSTVFSILRAIIGRKFIVPEIYDLMENISEIMVTSQSPQAQELCRGTLLQFLLDYPQGKGRLRTQMTFLAKNLSYVHESGRKSVMEFLGAVISKFQENLIMEYADMLFVALVMVVANDDSAKCREMAAVIIKALISRLDDERRKIMVSHLRNWATQQTQPLLSRVSVQVTGFIIDELQQDISPYIPHILGDLKMALERSDQLVLSLEEERDDDMQVDLEWQLSYQVLSVLFKLFHVEPSIATDEKQFGSWPIVVSHLLFPHTWVRTAACRLIGFLFTAVPAASRSDLPNNHPLSSSGMREVANNLCLQMRSPHLDNNLGLQIVKNLFFVGKSFLLIGASSNPTSGAESSDSDEEEEEEEEPAENSNVSKNSNPLPWLFSKVSYQIKSSHIVRRSRSNCLKNWAIQPLSCLRWFAAMASVMEPSTLELFLVHILNPVYRITEDDTIHDDQMPELKTTAVELRELIQKQVGTTKFSAVYNQIRQNVLTTQRERKNARQIQAVSNPEAAARRKMQRNLGKKESRKRKDRGHVEAKGKYKKRRED